MNKKQKTKPKKRLPKYLHTVSVENVLRSHSKRVMLPSLRGSSVSDPEREPCRKLGMLSQCHTMCVCIHQLVGWSVNLRSPWPEQHKPVCAQPTHKPVCALSVTHKPACSQPINRPVSAQPTHRPVPAQPTHKLVPAQPTHRPAPAQA